MKNRTLIGLFIILTTIYGLTQLFPGKRARSFSATLVAIDTSKVTSILLTPKGTAMEISILREKNGWIASNGQLNVKAQTEMVQNLLATLTSISTNQVVAKKTAQWKDFEVEEKQGTHIRVYQGKKLLTDFILGKLDVNAPMQQAISYLRLNGENEVYAIEGLVTMNFAQDFNAFRNHTLLKMKADMEVMAFDYQERDTAFQFIKTNTGWKLGINSCDSMQVENCLNVLRKVEGERFADDFDEVQGSKFLYKILTLKGKNIEDSLVISCYRDTTRQLPFVIQSNQSPESFFASDSIGIYKQIFNPINKLVRNQATTYPAKK